MNREPAYQALARALRDALVRGRYPDGVRLPTEAELAAEHHVSRQTVRRAFHDLVADGLVHRVPGRGTFAAPRDGRYLRQFGTIDDLMGLSIDTRLEIITPLRRRVDVDAASRLRLTGDVVHTVVFRRLHNDVPFCVTTVHLPPRVAESLATEPTLTSPGATSATTVIAMVDTRFPIAEAEQSITAVPAAPPATTHLPCATGEPLLRVDRTYHSTRGEPVELAISYFLPEHYSYRVHLRRAAT
ncbi:GntR family transcriptional regulator [Actinophytocola sp. KF-1]